MRKLIFILLCLSFSLQLFSQTNRDSVQKNHSTIFTKKNAIIAGLIIQQVGSFAIEYQWWWKNNYHSFVVYPDGWFDNYSLGVDKVGHFYTSYLYFNILNEVMKWGEFSDRTRIITAVSFPFFYALSVEIGDGFSSYNFSYEDLAANSAGIAYGFLQEKIPFFQNFTFKFSYFPSDYSFNSNFRDWKLTSDYEGHIYWLSFDIHNLLPQDYQKFWPKFLNIAAGYGMSGIESGANIQRKFLFGIDFNLSSFHTKSKALNAALHIVDKFKFPAPGFKKIGDDSFKSSILILN